MWGREGGRGAGGQGEGGGTSHCTLSVELLSESRETLNFSATALNALLPAAMLRGPYCVLPSLGRRG